MDTQFKYVGANEKTHPAKSWHCVVCTSIMHGSDTRCTACGNPRIIPRRVGAKPVPEAVAHQQCKRLHGNYQRWPPQQFGDQWVMVVTSDPRPNPDGSGPFKEPDEMRQLLEWGWQRVEPGVFQREVEPMKVLVLG